MQHEEICCNSRVLLKMVHFTFSSTVAFMIPALSRILKEVLSSFGSRSTSKLNKSFKKETVDTIHFADNIALLSSVMNTKSLPVI